MIQLVLFSVIAGFGIAFLAIPFTISNRWTGKKKKKTEEKKPLSFRYVPNVISLGLLLSIGIAVFYYISTMDYNWTTLWVLFILATGISTILAGKKERSVRLILAVTAIGFGIYLLTAPFFNATKKYEAMEMEQQVEITPFDETKKPASVPPKFARNKMKKAFGQVPNTSYYELGHLQIQKVNDAYVYIAPVEFSGFFKWFKGKTTPGYFTMSATDSADNPRFIKTEMTYTPSSYLGKKVERHMRMQEPRLIFYGDVQLEINEEGKPYYIRSYGNFITARDGFDVQGIVLVDVATGKTTKHPLTEIPEFVDGAVAPEVVSLQNSYFGKYVHGYWNSLFGKKDVKLPSDEGVEANVSPVFDETGHMYYFTDFTSPKEGVDSMLGYALTDARTGEATYYTGNLEESYMDSQGALQIIEKKFIEKKWNGQMPVLYNFYGEASWLTPVMDSNGFLQNYFIVSAANPEVSVFADTPNEALKLYKNALQRGGTTVDGSSSAEEEQATLTVTRVFKERVGDYTLVSFLAQNGQNYMVSSEVEPLAIYLQEGDQVTVTYLATEELFLPIKTLVIVGMQTPQ